MHHRLHDPLDELIKAHGEEGRTGSRLTMPGWGWCAPPGRSRRTSRAGHPVARGALLADCSHRTLPQIGAAGTAPAGAISATYKDGGACGELARPAAQPRWQRCGLPRHDTLLVRCKGSPAAVREARMARIEVALEDDLDGGPAEESLRFAIGGTRSTRSIFSKKNAKAFRKKGLRALHRACPQGRTRTRHVAGERAPQQLASAAPGNWARRKPTTSRSATAATSSASIAEAVQRRYQVTGTHRAHPGHAPGLPGARSPGPADRSRP